MARGDRGRIFSRHFLESLSPPFIQRVPEGAKTLDVGSGGGFPGIPLAILRADTRLTLVEPRQKKGAFLDRAILSLGIRNAVVFLGTIEELGRLGREPEYDLAVSRGIRWTPEMIQGLDRLLLPEGLLLRFGGIEGTEDLGGSVEAVSEDRGIQIWPRASWGGLPAAP